jgi:hypothetical protein
MIKIYAAGKIGCVKIDGIRTRPLNFFNQRLNLSSRQIIEILAIGPRKTIYEETYRIIKRAASRDKNAK